MSILLSLKIRYKNQPAVITRRGHQTRVMRKKWDVKKDKTKKQFIFSSQGKTVLSPQVNTRSSVALWHLPARQTGLEYVGFFFASVECYSAQVDMAQHRLPSESLRVELDIQAQVQDCYQWSLARLFYSQHYLRYNVEARAQHLCHWFQAECCFYLDRSNTQLISFTTDGKRD